MADLQREMDRCATCGHMRVQHSPSGRCCAVVAARSGSQCRCREFVEPQHKTRPLNGEEHKLDNAEARIGELRAVLEAVLDDDGHVSPATQRLIEHVLDHDRLAVVRAAELKVIEAARHASLDPHNDPIREAVRALRKLRGEA